MRVVFTATARADLRQIGRRIAADNPERARSFLRELRKRAEELGKWPERFPLVHPAQPVRKRLYGKYLILSRPDAARVAVIRVVHGSRDHQSLLFPYE